MNNNDKLLAILELTAKKLNPPYKKESKPIVVNGIEKVDFERLNPYLRYLRGYGVVNAKNIIERQKESISGWGLTKPIGDGLVNAMVKIDDTTIAIAKGDSLYIVDILSNECIKELAHDCWVNSLSILADNSIVSGGSNGKIIIWQLENGKYEKLSELTHGSSVNSLAVLSDNSIVAGGDYGKLTIWRLQNGKYEKFSELTHGIGVLSLSNLEDYLIVSGGNDGKVIIWGLQNGKYEKLSELTHESLVLSLTVLADNSIVSGGSNGKVIIWQLQNGEYKKLSELACESGVNSLTILADNSIVSGDSNGKVIIWRFQNGEYKKLSELTHGSWISSLTALSGNSIVSGGDDGEIVIHNLKNANNQIRLRNTEDEEVYKIYIDGKWRISRTKGVWRYGDDELMYKYGWFTNGSRCVPYYCFDEAEVMEYFLDAQELPIG